MKASRPSPKRHDDEAASRWRGELFGPFQSPLMWKGDEFYEVLEPPHSVTFPICDACGHVIWDWPHFEEEVPKNAVCEVCFKEERDA